jgi:hypothetical protein
MWTFDVDIATTAERNENPRGTIGCQRERGRSLCVIESLYRPQALPCLAIYLFRDRVSIDGEEDTIYLFGFLV